MKLLDFFRKQLALVSEDDHSISLKRAYNIGDLCEILAIYDECCQLGISTQINFNCVTESNHEVVLSNFRLQQRGVEFLIESVSDAKRADLTYRLAIAKSLQHDNMKLIEALEEPFSECSGLLDISLYISKSDLCDHFQNKYPSDSLSFGFWLAFQNFTAFIHNYTERFLRTVWGGKFPIFVVYDTQMEVKCKFCRVVTASNLIREDVDNEAYNVFVNLATEILSRGIGTRFLLNLTLCPLDSESRTLLQNCIDKKIVEEQTPLRFGESQYYDFKAKPTNIARNVTAFANACGGMLIYGIGNDGKVQGCDPSLDPDSVSNAIREIQPAVKCDVIDSNIGGKYVFILIVFPGEVNVVYTDGAGQRPFRYLSSIRLLRTDEEVLATRRIQCGGPG